ncbi:hypothetical protein C8A03DRAFT_37072 [Achaetomium macrosporum]|uniref:Uncharacterized protein n=1 Tax=Achaetomium macrosporum TaxID=79813 RepID=A0AAN7H4V2_9PEZI|nr:hypothetical protein C8A03DRAFT_37072 [Achaetomium macrosporum]
MLLVSLPNRPYRYQHHQRQQPEPNTVSDNTPDTPPPLRPERMQNKQGTADPTRQGSARRKPRPGAILVRSRPSPAAAPGFTARDLTRWYEHKHIPEVLATGGVGFAVRYQLRLPQEGEKQQQGQQQQQLPSLGRTGTKRKRRQQKVEGGGLREKRKRAGNPQDPESVSGSGSGSDTPTPEDAADREEGNQNKNQQSPSAETQMPFLAVYWLGDMGWLHEEGCPFWGVSLALDDEKSDEQLGRDRGDADSKGERRSRSVVEVAEFEAGFWEVVGRVDFGEGGRSATEAEGPAKHLVLVYLDAEHGDGKDAETVLRASWPGLIAARRVRSTLFKTDPTRPCPPAAKGLKEEGGIRQCEKNYLCLHEVLGDTIDMTAVLGADALHYTLLRAFGEQEHLENETP